MKNLNTTQASKIEAQKENPDYKKSINSVGILFLTGVVTMLGIIVHIFLFPNQRNNLYDGVPFLFGGIALSTVGILGVINKKLFDLRPVNPIDLASFSLLDRLFGYDKELNISPVGNRHIGGTFGLPYSVIYLSLGLLFIFIGIVAYLSTPTFNSGNSILNNSLYSYPLFHVFLSVFFMFFFGFVVIKALFLNTGKASNKIIAFFVKIFYSFGALVALLFFFRRTGCYLEDANSQPVSEQLQIIQIVNNKNDEKNFTKYKNENNSCKLTKINLLPYFVAKNIKRETHVFSVPIYVANQLKEGRSAIVDYYQNMDLMIKMITLDQ